MNMKVRDGSLTLMGVVFLSFVSLIIGYQLIIYQNYQTVNNNLINEYQLKIKAIQRHKPLASNIIFLCGKM